MGIEPDEIAIVNVGSLTDHKGQRWLIDAVPEICGRFPKARVWIFGEGELRAELEQRIGRLKLESRVCLMGHDAEVRAKLSAFDLFVSSSHLEGLGTSILDAMLTRLPVVAAATGGVTDSVIEDRTGKLCKAADAASLAQTVIAMLELSAEDRARLVDGALLNVESKFSADAMVRGTLKVYDRLLGG